jgi:hypothetical protein
MEWISSTDEACSWNLLSSVWSDVRRVLLDNQYPILVTFFAAPAHFSAERVGAARAQQRMAPAQHF